MKNRLLKTLRWLLPWLVIIAVAVFFYKTLSGNFDQLRSISFNFDVWVVLGLISFTLAVVISGVLWGRLLEKIIGGPVSVSDSIRVHAASWLLKYIPGQVGSYLNKIAWGKSRDISKKSISTSFIYENVLMVIAGISLSIPALTLFSGQAMSSIGLFTPALVVIPMLVVFSRKLFYRLVNKIFSIFGRRGLDRSDLLTGKDLLMYQFGYLLPRLLNGIGFVFIVNSLLVIHPDMYIGLASIYILASIVGLLTVFVPGGIGVREAVIVAFLTAYFPLEQAIIVAIVTRLYGTISDIGVGVVYLVLNKGRIQQL